MSTYQLFGGTLVDPTQEFHHNLGHWIKRVDHAITLRTNAFLRPHGLARSQWEVLFRIAATEGVTQKSLQSAMQVESGTLTGIVDTLIKKGWITRTAHPQDRRVNLLQLTIEGRQRWRAVPNPITELRPRMMQGISAADEAWAIHILQQAVRNLDTSPAKEDES